MKRLPKGIKLDYMQSQNPDDKEKRTKHIQLYKGHTVLCKRRIRDRTTPVSLAFLSSLVKRVILLLMGTELPFNHFFFQRNIPCGL